MIRRAIVKVVRIAREAKDRLADGLASVRARVVAGAATAIAVLGQAVDTRTMTDMLQSLLPLIVTLIAIAIPIIFFNKIIELLERLLRGFS